MTQSHPQRGKYDKITQMKKSIDFGKKKGDLQATKKRNKGSMTATEARQTAQTILNSGKYLTNYEFKFLKRVPHIIDIHGDLTTKQYKLLYSLSQKNHIKLTIEEKSKKTTSTAAAYMLHDLTNVSHLMTPADKQIYRKQIIISKKQSIDDVDKNTLWRLFRKYRENITL